jgi:outer membrane protein TolC
MRESISMLALIATAFACGCAHSAARRGLHAASIHQPSLSPAYHSATKTTTVSAEQEVSGDTLSSTVTQVNAAEPDAYEIILDLASDTSPEIPPGPDEVAEGTVELPPRRYLSKTTLPIDITSVCRLVNSNSPTVGLSQAKVREAVARAEAADVLWLPNLTAGVTYNRFDGQTQNQRGEIFSVSRSNLFANGGVALTLDPAEAIYRPLIEWRLACAEQQRAVAVTVTAELDAVLAYLDLLHAHGMLRVNAETLQKGEALLKAAMNAHEAKLDRSPGDINRVRTEVLLRRQERLDLVSRASVASARLGKLLLLDPTVRLDPQTNELVPITLVSPETPLEELMSIAVQHQRGPYLPKLQVLEQGGSFGGGINDDVDRFDSRNTVSALLYWEVKNLGFGNAAEERERRAGVDSLHFQSVEVQARVAAEVVESAEVSLAKSEGLSLAQEAVNEALELYRINQEGTFHVVDAKNLFDALRPLQALQFLHQARQNYVMAVLDYTRAQYRLHAAMGCPDSAGNLNPPGPAER